MKVQYITPKFEQKLNNNNNDEQPHFSKPIRHGALMLLT